MELQASRSEALNNKLACCWRSFSFSPSPGEWPLKPWTLDFCTPPIRKKRFSRKGSQNAGAENGEPPPPRGGFGFEQGKKRFGNFLGAPSGASKVFFFCPGGPPRVPRSRFYMILVVTWADSKPKTIFGTILGRRRLRNQDFQVFCKEHRK